MANKDRANGFKPVGDVKQIAIAQTSAATYAGEFVSLSSAGQVAPSAAGATIYGLALDTATASGVDIRVSVCPDQLYVAEASTSVAAQTAVGNLCDIVATSHNTTYKSSRQTIDSSTAGTGAGGQLMLVGIDKSIDNAFGTNVRMIVKINEHQAFGADAFAGI